MWRLRKKRMKRFKAVMAILAVILILAAVVAFFVSAVTGNRYFMGYFYLMWIVPVLLWIFAKLADILGKYGPAARDSLEVIEIEEPDFGCEGRPEGQPLFLKVLLRHRKTGEERIMEISEQNLNQEGIVEGDFVRETKNILIKL